MKTIFTILLFTIFNQTFAQTGKLYKGTIDNKFSITFYLENIDEGTYADPIIGAYKYENKKEYSLLNGFKNKDGNISLVELSTANFSGTFLGTLNENIIIGKWISANQNRTFSFDLKEIVATKKQLTEFRNAIERKANEFRNY